MIEFIQSRCEKYIKYFDYAQIEGSSIINENAFFTYNIYSPFTGDFKCGEYLVMNERHKKWILDKPEETRKIKANAKKLFPDENHVGRYVSIGFGLLFIYTETLITITKKKDN